MVSVVNILWRDIKLDIFFNGNVSRVDTDWLQVGEVKIPASIFCDRRSATQFRLPPDAVVKRRVASYSFWHGDAEITIPTNLIAKIALAAEADLSAPQGVDW